MIFTVAISENHKSGLPEQQNNEKVSFEKRINVIHTKVTDLTDIFALHDIKEFNDVYFDPVNYRDSVIQYLRKPQSLENKIIAICTMTRLPLNNYIDMLNTYFTLYSENIINEELLNRCIFNEFDSDYRLAKEYESPIVRQLLNKILNSKSLSKGFRANIKETLNGKWFSDLKRTGHL